MWVAGHGEIKTKRPDQRPYAPMALTVIVPNTTSGMEKKIVKYEETENRPPPEI